ncbi:hypothetical protein S7711_00977 [Stachybotrys chartarum IBT 7711]|uniref:DUF7721 domain-containing protein n=1 Tax=Stachybotrys chartarum (strain CBS 109288 / IBT 7711) TaxID=1280523 RepID=A0A084B0S5_STACB|nr:hypothetical protein S7711_00977 [Stachybotrys chartarum IBT 7711]KFA47139.1 hypothetical protein S40293_09521 [Stachybotrys chartarum IBT 40293]KFA78655.1 hypothetical protein S40288_06935 [Stachybotrys chartarum IBT 40288]
MDKLFNAGKEFLEERNQSQGQGEQSPSRRQYVYSQYPRHPSHSTSPDEPRLSSIATVACVPNTALEAHGGNYPAGGGFQAPDDDDDFRTAREEAASRAGSSGSSELFSSILGSIGQNRSRLDKDDIDEQDAVNKHKKTYDDDDDDNDEDTLGKAAAIQALKLFNQGETGGKQSQGAFLGLAMSEASKLFDDKASKGKVSSDASKESTIQKAGEMALKMYLKSQGQQQQGGLMGLASKFL